MARRSCSVPSSGRRTDAWPARPFRAGAARPRSRARRAAGGARGPRRARRAARRVPRVRTADGGNPDRGPGAVDRGGRKPGHGADRDRGQRRSRPDDAALQIGAGPVVGADPVRARVRRDPRPPDGRRADRAGAAAPAARGASTGADAAAFLHQSRDEGRAVVDEARPDAVVRIGALDDPATADGGPRRRQRRGLGPARPAIAGAGRSRSSARFRRDAGGSTRRGGRRGSGRGRRVRRHAQPAACGPAGGHRPDGG